MGVAQVEAKIRDAAERLKSLRALPRKSDIDWTMIEQLENYIADLMDDLGDAKREEFDE